MRCTQRPAMRELPARFLSAVSDVTIGTAIVMVHAWLYGTQRANKRLTAEPLEVTAMSARPSPSRSPVAS